MRLLSAGPPSQSWPIGLQENNNKFQESCLWGNQQLVKKQYVTHSTKFKYWHQKFFKKANCFSKLCLYIREKKVFLFETNAQETYLFDTSCYRDYVIYQQFLRYHGRTLQ